MTLAEFINVIGFKVDNSDVDNVNRTFQDIKNTARDMLGAIGIGLSISGIKNAIQECIALASEAEEMQNKFDVVFDGMTDTVEQWAKDYSDAIGRNANDIKTYMADMQNLVVGFMGQDMRAEAMELSQAMTTLALDLASFNNIDEKYAVNAMQKAVMGETESAKSLGAVLNDVTRAEAMLTLGIQGKYEALDQATKMQVNYQAIVNQSKDAIGDCERSVNSYRSTLIAFESKSKEIKTLIGQFFMPAAQKIIRFGTVGLSVLRDGVQALNDFAESMGGSTRMIAVFGSTLAFAMLLLNADRIIKFGGAIKGLVKNLFSIKPATLGAIAIFLLLAAAIEDFYVFMKGGNSMLGKLLESAGIDADKFRARIQDSFQKIKDLVLPLIQGFCDGFMMMLQSVKGFWDSWGGDIMKGIGSVIGTIGDAIMSFIEFVSGAEGADDVMHGIGQAIAVIGGVLITVLPMIKLFSGAFKVATGVMGLLSNPIGQVIAIILALIIIIGLLVKNWDKIKDAAGKAWDWIVGKWNGAAQWFKQTVTDPIVGFFTGLRDKAIAIFQGILDWVSANWQSILLFFINPFAGVFKYLYDNFEGFRNFVDGIIEGVRTTAGGILDAVTEGFGAAIEWITGLPAKAINWGKDIIDSIIEGVKSGFSIFTSLFGGEVSLMASAGTVSASTAGNVSTSSTKSVVQNVEINNEFNGDAAIQQKASSAMDKAANDTTAELARGLAYAK